MLNRFGIIMSILTILFLASGCADETIVQTKIEQSHIAIQARPKPVTLNDVKFYVVTKDNLNTFLETFRKEQQDLVFYAMSVKDYENIALNIADLRRFLLQQTELIVYYENAIKKQTTK